MAVPPRLRPDRRRGLSPGASPGVCGVGPQIARTLVELGLDLGRVAVCGSVRSGLTLALRGPRA